MWRTPNRQGGSSRKRRVNSEEPQQHLENTHQTPPPPVSPLRAPRARVIVHPALFWSVFDAMNRTCNESAIDLVLDRGLYRPSKEGDTVSRQTKVGVHFPVRVSPQFRCAA